MEDIFYRIVDMPSSVKGVTVRDSNGDYNIYISSRLSAWGQQMVLEHELTHIRRGHFQSRRPLGTLELEADFLSKSRVHKKAL